MADIAFAAAAKIGGGIFNLVKPLLPYIAIAAVGFGAAEGWEHRKHESFPLSLLGQGLKAQLVAEKASEPAKLAAAQQAGADAQAKSDKAAFSQWSAALQKCTADAKATRDSSAQDLVSAEKFATVQSSAAYRLGRASCGAPSHGPSSSPGAQPGAQPGGVRNPPDDLSALVGAGAFTPGA